MYMLGDHTIPVPYKVRRDYMIPIPYKVCGDHKSHIRHEDTLHMEGNTYMWGII